ncbi:MAG TPA: FecR domain-containing protein [Polyangiaceae bacterium]|nr:FecR domain-containing protein [Polyangiaceae bacterium]
MADIDPLESLAAELRKQLGSPGEGWIQAQRARVCSAKPPPSRPGRSASVILALSALTGVAAVTAVALVREGLQEPSGAASSEADVWMNGDVTSSPYRLTDGSTIELERGAQGRLSLRSEQVGFDLQQGEAHFDVTHRPGQHWTVVVGEYRVDIVGTRFSIRRPENDGLEVRVEHGIVSVRIPKRSDAITLHAGERLAARAGRVLVERFGETVAPPAGSVATPSLAQGRLSEPYAVASAGRSAANAHVAASDAAGPADSGWQKLYREGRYELALAAAKRAGVDRSIRSLGAEALSELADTARLGGDPALAIQALRVIEQRYPNSSTAISAPFLLGRIYAMKGDRNAAITAFEQYLSKDSRATYANEAIGRLMGLYSSRGDALDAEEMARLYLARAPHGPYRRQAASLVHER